MKAIIIKDNNFETIGFEVSNLGKTLFYWGVPSLLKYNFQKEIDTSIWAKEIFELVRIESAINERSKFASEFLNIVSRECIIKDGKGISFDENEKELKSLRAKLEKIIKGII